MRTGHRTVPGWIIEKGRGFGHYAVRVRPDQLGCPGLQPFWTLGCVTQHQNRLTKGGGLFLNSATVRQDQRAH